MRNPRWRDDSPFSSHYECPADFRFSLEPDAPKLEYHSEMMTPSQKTAIGCGTVTALLLIALAVSVLSMLVRGNRSARAPIHFDLSSRVEIPNHPALQFHRNPFSISMWFRTTTQRKYIAFMGKRISGMGVGWVLGANDENGLSFYTAACASPASRPQSFRDGQWHHLVVTRNGQTMTFFY